MSEFTKKVLDGCPTTDAEWNAHLLEAHEAAPGMSPPLFGRCRNSVGQNSYEFLAEVLKGLSGMPINLIDLACGDGSLIPYCRKHLPTQEKIIGVDMSEAELNLARKHHAAPNTEFHLSSADRLPFPVNGADAVLCHMALMLMVPIEPVVKEIHRVLKPGGIFAAAIFHRPEATGVYKALLVRAGEFIKSTFQNFQSPKTGDDRLQTQEGVRELLVGVGRFRTVEKIEDQQFYCSLAPTDVWDMMKDMYLIIGMLPEAQKQQLKKDLIQTAEGQATGGTISFSIPCRLITARK